MVSSGRRDRAAAERARERQDSQVMMPSPTDSAAEVEKFAASVNSV